LLIKIAIRIAIRTTKETRIRIAIKRRILVDGRRVARLYYGVR